MDSLKALIKFLFSVLGGFEFSRFLARRHPRIIMYHRFSESPVNRYLDQKNFARQLDLLKQKFNVISLQEMVYSLETESRLPDHSIVLTIDDGYDDFYRIAYPELKQRNLPATIFVTTGFVEQKTWLWPDYASYILEVMTRDNKTFRMPNSNEEFQLPEQYNKIWQSLMNKLISLPLKEKEAWLTEFARQQGIEFPQEMPGQYKPISWEQVQEMDAYGITIGAHTVNHPNLSREAGERVKWEIRECKTILEDKLSHAVDFFCYPNGEQYDYTEETEKMVAEAGFRAAVVAHHDYRSMNNKYALPRFAVGKNWHQFKKVVYGVEWLKCSL